MLLFIATITLSRLCSWPLAVTISIILSFHECHRDGIIEYESFGIAFSFSIILWRCIQAACLNSSFLLLPSSITMYWCTSFCLIIYSNHSLKGMLVIFRFSLSQRKLLWIFIYRFFVWTWVFFLWDVQSAVAGL